MIYLLNLLLVPLYYLFIQNSIKDKEKAKKSFAIIVGIHAVLFRAMANPFNYVDTELYDEGFRSISQMTFSEAILQVNFYTEWGTGYVLFNWIISRFTTDSKYLFMLASALSIIPVIWFYFKTSKTLLPTVLIFLLYPMMYLMGFGVIRQHMSVAYILLALYYVDRLKISLPLALLGFSLHTSGIVFFPFYLLKKIDFSKIKVDKLALYIIIILSICRLSMNYVLAYMPKYEKIVGADRFDNNVVPAVWMGTLLLLAISSRINRRLSTSLEKDIFSFFIYGTAIAIFCIGLPGMGRFTICFLYIVPIFTSFFYSYGNRGIRNIANIINIAIITRQLFYSVTKESSNFDYSFFWE